MNFSAYFPNFTSRSEIEIFASRKGNYTNFHMDFQENFTVQLKGRKTWRVMKSGYPSPLRGFTPHYKHSGNLEEQLKIIYQTCQLEYDERFLLDNCEELVLEEGDILYHPAGIWHSVECDEDSIAINFSLRNLNMSDMIGNGLRHVMNAD